MNTSKNPKIDANTLQKELSGLSAKLDEVIRLLKKQNTESSRKTHFADLINKNRIRR